MILFYRHDELVIEITVVNSIYLKLFISAFVDIGRNKGVNNMHLFEINVTKKNDCLLIKWQLSKLEIPLTDITEVFYDNTYGGEDKTAFRIGNPYASTDTVVIKTRTETYILFTNIGGMKERILSYIA